MYARLSTLITLLFLFAGSLYGQSDTTAADTVRIDTTAVDTASVDTTGVDTMQVDTAEVQQAVEAELRTTDAALEARLRAVFESLEEFEDVRVKVQAGVVRLTGTVIDGEAETQAGELASSFDGVIYVLNDLQPSMQIEARVVPAARRIQEYLANTIAYLPILAVALLVLMLFWFIANRLSGWNALYRRFGLSQIVQNLISRLVRLVILVVGLLLVFDILGITTLVGTLLGTAGIIGIAVGFAFQDIIENYLAGILMSVRQPFNLNDAIKIGDQEGKVVRLTAREMVMMTFEGNHVRIPNATVFKSTVINYTRNPLRRFSFEVGIDVGENLKEVQRLGVETLEALNGVLEKPAPMMVINTLGDSNIVVEFFGWVDQTEADFLKVRSEAIRLVKVALDEAEIIMPEPIFNIRMQTLEALGITAAEDEVDHSVDPIPASEQAPQAEVTPQTDLDDQIRKDQAASDEPNLLAE